jgi:hypothetical protein
LLNKKTAAGEPEEVVKRCRELGFAMVHTEGASTLKWAAAALPGIKTTGLLKPAIPECPIAKQPRVIEFFGQVLGEVGAPLHELYFLCDPGVPVTAKITEITGIEPPIVSTRRTRSDEPCRF